MSSFECGSNGKSWWYLTAVPEPGNLRFILVASNFILGEKEESLLELKRKTIGFQSETKPVRKKRKYTRRKKK